MTKAQFRKSKVRDKNPQKLEAAYLMQIFSADFKYVAGCSLVNLMV